MDIVRAFIELLTKELQTEFKSPTSITYWKQLGTIAFAH